MASNNKKKRKASYEGYMAILIEESTLRSAENAIPESFNFWEWVHAMGTEGYEFSFEIESDTDAALCVLKQMNPSAVDAGIYMFTSGDNFYEALLLTWYKYVVLNHNMPLQKSEAKPKSKYR